MMRCLYLLISVSISICLAIIAGYYSTYAVEYYLAIKRNRVLIYAMMNLKTIMLLILMVAKQTNRQTKYCWNNHLAF